MTERREHEQQIRREQDLVEEILETSPVGIAVVNPDGTTSRANQRMGELLNLSPDTDDYTTAQRDLYDATGELLPVEDRPVLQVYETGEPVTDCEILLKQRDGSRQWVSITARPVSDGGTEPAQVIETATDITDLKDLAEGRKRDLKEREKELAAIQLATDLFESGDQPLDELLCEFVTYLPQFFSSPASTAARVSVGDTEASTANFGGGCQRISAHTSTVNKTPITVDIALTAEPESLNREQAFLAEEQELIDTLAILLKVHSDRFEYLEELRESNKRLEQFAYAASHDLQEPLRMVTSYLQLINQRYADALNAEAEEFLEFAVDGATRMREMIDGLLEYSRVEHQGNPMELVDLDTVLADSLDDLRLSIEAHDAAITTESLPAVEGDASQLRQVFLNLLENAIAYSGEASPRVHIGAEHDNGMVVVSVSDQGVGVEPDATDRVFEVFQRLHTQNEHPGTGIGLALCQRIIERHGGTIWVESELRVGSTFKFSLSAASHSDNS